MKRTGIFILLLAVATSLLAQSDTEKLKKTVEERVNIYQQTQRKQDDWESEKTDLTIRYRNAQANVNFLEERKAAEEDKVWALEERIAEFRRRLLEADRLTDNLQDTLDVVLERLDLWVKRDLPFLPDERRARIEMLRHELARPDVEGADKLRLLLESLQIEALYGGSVEVHQQRIAVEQDTLFVDILRVGRVSVFWRTPEGKLIGEYDRARGAWVELPGKYKRAISDAMDMASRMRPVELISLPLGRIER
ncbi:MAG: DUF3450 domain-containing protein [Candidatus Krumholzibacteriota bacterium]|nr:DUF3450 domain-containing protein [Candidatus Krumholzibacteriota bacterium]